MAAPRPANPHDRFLELGRVLGARAEGSAMRFERDGRGFAMTFTAAGKNTPPKVRFATPAGPLAHPPDAGALHGARGGPFRGDALGRAPSPAPMLLRAETGTDRFGKRIGMNREVELGDAAFDARIYIETDAPDERVRDVLAESAVRGAVLRCLDLGATDVSLNEAGELGVQLPVMSTDALATPSVLLLLGALGAAAEAMPPIALQPRRGMGFRDRIAAFALLGTLIALPLFFLFRSLWGAIESDLSAAGVLAGGGAWLVAIPILWRVMRGSSTSLRNLGLVLFFSLFGLPLAAVDVLLFINGALDRSAPAAHVEDVVNRRVSGGKSTTYYLVVRSWRPDESTVELTVSSGDYVRFAPGSKVVVTTRAGLLGWERMVSIEAPAER
jgi:hypothetical protein